MKRGSLLFGVMIAAIVALLVAVVENCRGSSEPAGPVAPSGAP